MGGTLFGVVLSDLRDLDPETVRSGTPSDMHAFITCSARALRARYNPSLLQVIIQDPLEVVVNLVPRIRVLREQIGAADSLHHQISPYIRGTARVAASGKQKRLTAIPVLGSIQNMVLAAPSQKPLMASRPHLESIKLRKRPGL